MKTRIILLAILIISPLISIGQNRQGPDFDRYFERYKSERIAYLTDQLDLSVKESEKFWPVYREYQTKKEKLMRQGRPARFRNDSESLDTKTMESIMDKKIENDLKMAELAAEYHLKFKELLGVEKVFKLYRAEHDFMGQMVRKMRDGYRPQGKRSRK